MTFFHYRRLRAWSPGSILVFALAVAVCSACSKDEPKSEPAGGDLRSLVRSDISGLSSISAEGSEAVEREWPGVIRQVFGGMDGGAFSRFYHDRIHLEVFPDDSVSTRETPEDSPRYEDWAKPRNRGGSSGGDEKPDSNVQVVASNLGIALWFQSAINRTQATLIVNGKDFPIQMPNHGVMSLGPGYRASVDTSDGGVINLPPAYRQTTLVHEARHSDCSGGVSESELDTVRRATDIQDFFEKYQHRHCGHLHTICPRGHDYEGYPACDDEPWGAYSIGAIFALAMVGNTSGIDHDIMRASASDAFSRLVNVDAEKMLEGKLGAPDMTSQDVSGR